MDAPTEHTLARKKPGERRDERPGKIQRISDQTRGLVEDLRSWVDLKVQLVQLDMEARVEERINRAVVGGLVAAVAGAAALFLLVAASLGLGVLLGHAGWGFGAVGLLLGVVALVLRMMQPRLVQDPLNREADE